MIIVIAIVCTLLVFTATIVEMHINPYYTGFCLVYAVDALNLLQRGCLHGLFYFLNYPSSFPLCPVTMIV